MNVSFLFFTASPFLPDILGQGRNRGEQVMYIFQKFPHILIVSIILHPATMVLEAIVFSLVSNNEYFRKNSPAKFLFLQLERKGNF